MFSKDITHYHPTPRTMQQAFGPYACFTPRAQRRTQYRIVCTALGVIAIGAWYGWMMYYGVA